MTTQDELGVPPTSAEAHEQKMISLAFKQAEYQMKRMKAPSTTVNHFLDLATKRTEAQLAKLELENRLLEEKIISEQNAQKVEEMFKEVLSALKSYTVPDDDY